MPFQGIQVDHLVVRRSVLPAAIDDADPLEGQRPQCSLAGGASVTLLVIEGLGPVTVRDRQGGELYEGLTQELGMERRGILCQRRRIDRE